MMSSRIRRIEQSVEAFEFVLLWLKQLQLKGGFSEFWKFSIFQTWPSESVRLGMLYNLVFQVNSAAMVATEKARSLSRWAALVGLALFEIPVPILSESAVDPKTPGVFEVAAIWREMLCNVFMEIVALRQATELISDRYFLGHKVLFSDTDRAIEIERERLIKLIHAYNWFAGENGLPSIDAVEIEKGQGPSLGRLLEEWTMLARSEALADNGELLQARDEILNYLRTERPTGT
jgi:hypothetical protein